MIEERFEERAIANMKANSTIEITSLVQSNYQ